MNTIYTNRFQREIESYPGDSGVPQHTSTPSEVREEDIRKERVEKTIIDAVNYGFRYALDSQNDGIKVPDGNTLQWWQVYSGEQKRGIDAALSSIQYKEEEPPGSLTETQFYKIRKLILACAERNVTPQDCFNICVSQKLCREEKDNTVTEGKESSTTKVNADSMPPGTLVTDNLLSTYPAPEETKVDYEKEARTYLNTYIQNNYDPNKANMPLSHVREVMAQFGQDIADNIRARQMSSPYDSNCKVKKLIEWIRTQIADFKQSTNSTDRACASYLEVCVLEKANSLIQQDKPGT